MHAVFGTPSARRGSSSSSRRRSWTVFQPQRIAPSPRRNRSPSPSIILRWIREITTGPTDPSNNPQSPIVRLPPIDNPFLLPLLRRRYDIDAKPIYHRLSTHISFRLLSLSLLSYVTGHAADDVSHVCYISQHTYAREREKENRKIWGILWAM